MPGSLPAEQTPTFKMKSKKFFNFRSKRRKKKSKQESPEVKIPKKRIRKLLVRIKTSLKKDYPEQIKAIKKFILIISGYGLIINYALYFLFQTKFSFFSLFAWGIAYYFVSDEFVEWFRRLIARR